MLKLIALLCRILPYRGRKYLGHCFGKLGYSFTESRREVAAGNLSRAFPGMEKNEVDNIVRDMYINLGYTLVEFFQTYKLAQEGIERYVEIENGKNLEQAYNRGQGVIFYSAHFGNWEWLGSFISALGYPLVAVARRQKSPI
ncbi:MAG: lysophospholipid acyltransferase family protein, partial [Halanaerobiaceae bacterium]